MFELLMLGIGFVMGVLFTCLGIVVALLDQKLLKGPNWPNRPSA